VIVGKKIRIGNHIKQKMYETKEDERKRMEKERRKKRKP
jgi:hypothetical protein